MHIDMSWIEANGGILAVIGSVISLYGFLRRAASKDSDALQKSMQEIKTDIKEMKLEIISIGNRLNRLEGRFEERGQWEVKEWKKQKVEGE